MASNPNLVQYIADQCSGAGTVTYRKMFGDYGMYLDGKFFALVCDDQFFIKRTTAGQAMAPELPLAPPYEGARDCLLVQELDDQDFLSQLALVTAQALPPPKEKRKKATK